MKQTSSENYDGSDDESSSLIDEDDLISDSSDDNIVVSKQKREMIVRQSLSIAHPSSSVVGNNQIFKYEKIDK